MSETTQQAEPKIETPQLSYDTYKRAIAEKKKIQQQLEQMQEQIKAIETAKQAEQEKQKREQGEFKSLYEELKAKHEAEANNSQKYLSELNTYKELLAQDIPEDVRNEFDITGLSVKQVQTLAIKFKQNPQTPHSVGSETITNGGNPIDIKSMDMNALNKLASENPQAYYKLIMEKTKG
jgi:predicted nuclease with TOPRIM domain